MTTIRVTALDTAQAMDEIVAKLGSDALIIDTIKRNGRIEMVATDDPDEHPANGTRRADSGQPDKVLAYQNRRQASDDMHRSASEVLADLQRQDAETLPRFNEIFDRKMISPLERGEDDATATAISSSRRTTHTGELEAGAIAHQLAEIKSMLNGMMITQPDGLKAQFGQTAAVQLRQAGFSPEVILALQAAFEGLPTDEGIAHFMDAIASQLVRTDTDALLERRLICVVGSSGSGKTTLASKIAAYCKERAIVDRFMLAAVTAKGTAADDEIKDYARLMNMKSLNFGIDELAERLHETSHRMIVDVSAPPEQAVDAIGACCREFGAGKVAVVQALPGGSSATMISHQCALYHGLDPMIALTKLDECEAMPPELSALVTHGTGIGLLTGTKSIVGGIAIATSQILTQYLKENA